MSPCTLAGPSQPTLTYSHGSCVELEPFLLLGLGQAVSPGLRPPLGLVFWGHHHEPPYGECIIDLTRNAMHLEWGPS